MLSVPSINRLSALLLLIYILLAISGIYFLLWQRYFSPICDIPGPRLASFDTCFQLWEIYNGKINDTLVQLHRKHGRFPTASSRLCWLIQHRSSELATTKSASPTLRLFRSCPLPYGKGISTNPLPSQIVIIVAWCPSAILSSTHPCAVT